MNKMTPELKAKLAGLLPMNDKFVLDYTPELYKDIPEEFRPVYKIKQLTVSQFNEMRRIISGKDKEIDKETKLLDIIKSCIVGWNNVYDLETETISEFTTSKLDTIPNKVMTDLNTKIQIISGFIQDV